VLHGNGGLIAVPSYSYKLPKRIKGILKAITAQIYKHRICRVISSDFLGLMSQDYVPLTLSPVSGDKNERRWLSGNQVVLVNQICEGTLSSVG